MDVQLEDSISTTSRRPKYKKGGLAINREEWMVITAE